MLRADTIGARWKDRVGMRFVSCAPRRWVVAVLSQALGIGTISAIFSLVDGLRLRALPVAEPDRLIIVSSATTC